MNKIYLKFLIPSACGFCVGFATRSHLSSSAQTSILKSPSFPLSEEDKQKGEGKRTANAAEETTTISTGEWCDCCSLARVHRLFLTSDAIPQFADSLKAFAAARTATRGFKSLSVFTRPLGGPQGGPQGAPQGGPLGGPHQGPPSTGPPQGAPSDVEAAQQHTSGRPHACREAAAEGDIFKGVGAEVVVIEEWLNPQAGMEVMLKSGGKKKSRRDMLGGSGAACSTWLCLKP